MPSANAHEISFTTVIPTSHPAYQAYLRKKNNSLLQKAYRTLHKFAAIKPQRIFGAVWTSEDVAARRAITMCESCWRSKYPRWWKAEHYRPDWGWNRIGNCDGCSLEFIFVTLFVAEEAFYTVLTESHGLYPKP